MPVAGLNRVNVISSPAMAQLRIHQAFSEAEHPMAHARAEVFKAIHRLVQKDQEVRLTRAYLAYPPSAGQSHRYQQQWLATAESWELEVDSCSPYTLAGVLAVVCMFLHPSLLPRLL